MRKGESRAGGGNGAVEISLGEERDERVKSKDGYTCLNGMLAGSVNMQFSSCCIAKET